MWKIWGNQCCVVPCSLISKCTPWAHISILSKQKVFIPSQPSPLCGKRSVTESGNTQFYNALWLNTHALWHGTIIIMGRNSCPVINELGVPFKSNHSANIFIMILGDSNFIFDWPCLFSNPEWDPHNDQTMFYWWPSGTGDWMQITHKTDPIPRVFCARFMLRWHTWKWKNGSKMMMLTLSIMGVKGQNGNWCVSDLSCWLKGQIVLKIQIMKKFQNSMNVSSHIVMMTGNFKVTICIPSMNDSRIHIPSMLFVMGSQISLNVCSWLVDDWL